MMHMRYIFFFFVLFLGTCFSAAAQQIDALLMESAITKLQHAKEYTLQVADLMPADKYSFKPSQEEMSFGEQLLHLSANLGWLSSAYLGAGENPVTKADAKLQNKEEVRALVIKAYDYALETFRKFNPANLADTVKFFAGPMNKLQIITLINDHQTHHRGQVLVYLRLNGIAPPRYVGW